MTFQTLKTSQIKQSNANPRKRFDEQAIQGLAQSILTDGLLQNLTVAKPKGKAKKHAIICGERRFRAICLLQEQGALPKDYAISVEIKDNLSDDDIHRIAAVENIQRQDLTPMEEARAIAGMIKEGDKLDDILAQTGFSESKIRRRLVLMQLNDTAQTALDDQNITLAQAEAMSLGNSDEQDDLVQAIQEGNGYWTDAESIKRRLVGSLPNVSMAVFPLKAYTGDFKTDLLAEDETTYFNDVEQFMSLQTQYCEKLLAEYKDKAEWAEFVEGYFSRWEYDHSEDETVGGVVIALNSRGEVEIHKGLIRTKADPETTQSLKKPKAPYSAPLCKHIAMHKTMAVQAQMLNNPRQVKELAVANKFNTLKVHGALPYLDKLDDGNHPPALLAMNAKAKEVLSFFNQTDEDATWSDVAELFQYDLDGAYDAVQNLSDEDLETTLLFLETLSFGQSFMDSLDVHDGSIFNRVALMVKADMRDYWRPDHAFLSRRNKMQLQQIINDIGVNAKFDNAQSLKKSDLVERLVKYFQDVMSIENPTDAELKAINWIPDAMAFPAIDSDKAKAEIGKINDEEDYAKAA